MPTDVFRSLILILFAVALWYIAYNAVTSAFSKYTQVYLGMNGTGFADCLLIATGAAILTYIPAGLVASKIGRRKTILIGICLMLFSFGCAIFFTAYHPLLIVLFALTGMGWASINVNSYPMVVEMSKGFQHWKIYWVLLYFFHGRTGHHTDSFRLPAGTCRVLDAVPLFCVFPCSCLYRHAFRSARRLKTTPA